MSTFLVARKYANPLHRINEELSTLDCSNATMWHIDY